MIQWMLAIWSLSGSSAFSKSSLNIWKFSVHVLLKPGLENFEHYFNWHVRWVQLCGRLQGKFGLGVQNEVGQRLIEFCQENALVIPNTLFQQQKRRLHKDITRWSTPKSDWLYSLQPKMEKFYTVSKNKTGSWLWHRPWTPYCRIQT